MSPLIGKSFGWSIHRFVPWFVSGPLVARSLSLIWSVRAVNQFFGPLGWLVPLLIFQSVIGFLVRLLSWPVDPSVSWSAFQLAGPLVPLVGWSVGPSVGPFLH